MLTFVAIVVALLTTGVGLGVLVVGGHDTLTREHLLTELYRYFDLEWALRDIKEIIGDKSYPELLRRTAKLSERWADLPWEIRECYYNSIRPDRLFLLDSNQYLLDMFFSIVQENPSASVPYGVQDTLARHFAKTREVDRLIDQLETAAMEAPQGVMKTTDLFIVRFLERRSDEISANQFMGLMNRVKDPDYRRQAAKAFLEVKEPPQSTQKVARLLLDLSWAVADSESGDEAERFERWVDYYFGELRREVAIPVISLMLESDRADSRPLEIMIAQAINHGIEIRASDERILDEVIRGDFSPKLCEQLSRWLAELSSSPTPAGQTAPA